MKLIKPFTVALCKQVISLKLSDIKYEILSIEPMSSVYRQNIFFKTL